MDSRMRAKGQVTVPRDVREAARIAEGDPIRFEIVEEGILLRPQKVVDASQAWFWTQEWQDGERRATEDIRKGRTEVFNSDADFLASLGE
ncbi:MAG: AbrB/MazE/SpoVT family DNA-binding domain-containing protein [Actinomycetota bacterium]|nr:AbrB/MazE/SpoVT family DNA-binding domain-containing protein [Actinomycetota bacterium]